MMASKSLQLFLVLLIIFSFSACVPSGKVVQDVQFDDIENTQAIALSPFYLPDPQEKRADHAWALTLKVSDGEPYFGLIKPSQMLTEPLYQFFSSLELKPGMSLPENLPEYKIDGCQGQAMVQAMFKANGSISGSVDYQNYADNCSLAVDTTLPFQGRFDSVTGELTIDLNYKNLSATMGTRSFLLGDKLRLGMSAFKGRKQNYHVESEMSLDETDGLKYHLDDMLLSWDFSGNYPQFSMAGKAFWGSYGKVEVVTSSPLVSYKKESPPWDGMLIFTGSEGAWRRLYFHKSVDPGAFRIDGSNGMKTMGKI